MVFTDMLKAGIDRSNSVLILADHGSEDYTIDSDNILSYMLVAANIRKNINVVVELSEYN